MQYFLKNFEFGKTRMRWKYRATTQGRPYGFTVFVIIFRDDVGIVPYVATNRPYNKYFATHHFEFSIFNFPFNNSTLGDHAGSPLLSTL